MPHVWLEPKCFVSYTQTKREQWSLAPSTYIQSVVDMRYFYSAFSLYVTTHSVLLCWSFTFKSSFRARKEGAHIKVKKMAQKAKFTSRGAALLHPAPPATGHSSVSSPLGKNSGPSLCAHLQNWCLFLTSTCFHHAAGLFAYMQNILEYSRLD